MTKRNALQALGLAHPVVQGPFGGGLSTVKLAATVADRGGLGSFGAHVLAPDAIGPLVAELRAATRGPFAINLWVSNHDAGGLAPTEEQFEAAWSAFEPYFAELGLPKPARPERTAPVFDEQVEALLESRPPAFSWVFGIPSARILEACRRRGIATIGAATTLAEAEALDAAGVDAIVATGMEAGGHRPSFLDSAERSLTGTAALVQVVAPRVSVPVIAAGGIVDAAGAAAMRALGAAAAQIGTAFLASEESNASTEHRAMLFGESARHTVLTRAFTGRLARGVENRWTREWADRGNKIAPYPLQSWFVAHLKRATPGRTDLASLWAGQSAPNLRHRTAAALMDALVAAPSPPTPTATEKAA